MTVEGTFRTVEDRVDASLSDRGSEFIAFLAPVDSIDAVESWYDTIRGTYPDATHHVMAYRIRTNEFLKEYSTDDGEPAGSAGKPVLRVLEGNDLENCAIVVIRYYGGTNLGIGGLVRAYGGVAGAAVDAAEIVEVRPTRTVRIEVEYDDSGTVRAILESESVPFEATYEGTVSFEADVPVEEASTFVDRVRSATSDRASIAFDD